MTLHNEVAPQRRRSTTKTLHNELKPGIIKNRKNLLSPIFSSTPFQICFQLARQAQKIVSKVVPMNLTDLMALRHSR